MNYSQVCCGWCGWLGSNVDEAARVLMCADTNIDPILIKYYYGQTRDIPPHTRLCRAEERHGAVSHSDLRHRQGDDNGVHCTQGMFGCQDVDPSLSEAGSYQQLMGQNCVTCH